MFYRMLRSIQARPNAWLFALGLAIAVLPFTVWCTAMAAHKTVDGLWEDGPVLGAIIKHFTGGKGYPQDAMQGAGPDIVRGYVDLVNTQWYGYSTLVGWLAGPVLMIVAIIRRLTARSTDAAG